MTSCPPSSSTASHRILLVDHEPIFRLGLRGVLQATNDLRVCAEAACRQSALEALRNCTPCLAILEVGLTGTSVGVRVAEEMLVQQPDLRLLILSTHRSPRLIADTFRLGVRGFASKSEQPEALLHATRTVLNGGIYVSPVFRDRPFFETLANPHSPINRALQRLSGREFQVFRLLGSGLTIREIGGKLQLSMKTVETHRAHVMQKLGLESAFDITRFATDWMCLHADRTGPVAP